jgi:two-component system response regulator NreC
MATTGIQAELTASQELEVITVMIAEGATLVSSALSVLLQESPTVEVIAMAGGIDDAERVARGNRPDVIVFDPHLPASADELADKVGRLRAASPSSHVMILTTQLDALAARAALRAGAIGYLLKDEEPKDLQTAIVLAVDAKPWISPRIAMAIDDSAPNGQLTAREREVVQLVALGHTNNEIADLMHLSVRTVETHRSSIMRKLEMTTRGELVRYAIDQGMMK